MKKIDHRLERRATLLADAFGKRVGTLTDMLMPEQQRPFAQQKNRTQALAWWREHRQDDLGAQVLALMPPEAIMDLDRALSQQIEAEQMSPPLGGA